MKNISFYITFFVLFFLGTSSITFITSDLGVKNENLNDESKVIVENLEIYRQYENSKRIGENNSIDYSLNGFEEADAFERENLEAKSFSFNFLFLGDLFLIIPIFLNSIMPFFSVAAYGWAFGILLGGIGFYFAIAFYNLIKNGDSN